MIRDLSLTLLTVGLLAATPVLARAENTAVSSHDTGQNTERLVALDVLGGPGGTTPEPSSLVLLGGGLLVASMTLRRKIRL